MAGDFNNNVRWDKGKKATNHAHTVAGLERLGLASAYHVGRGELHGKESLATLHGRDRKVDGPKYHVEYCFMPLEWCSCLRGIEVGAFDAWVGNGLSDHVPVVVDVDVPIQQDGKSPKLPRRFGQIWRASQLSRGTPLSPLQAPTNSPASLGARPGPRSSPQPSPAPNGAARISSGCWAARTPRSLALVPERHAAERRLPSGRLGGWLDSSAGGRSSSSQSATPS